MIVISLYDGAYGPTVRVDTQNIQELDRINKILLSLMSGSVREVDLGTETLAFMDGLETVLLRTVPLEEAPEGKIARGRDALFPPSFAVAASLRNRLFGSS